MLTLVCTVARLRVAVALVLATAHGLASAAPPGVPRFDAWALPESVVATEIAPSLTVDGARVRMYEIRSPLPREPIAAAWQRLWSAASHSVAVADAAGWHVLSTPVSAGLLTVQLRTSAAGGTEGYLALAARSLANASRTHAAIPASVLRLPAGSRVLRSIESRDAGRLAVQTVLRLPLDGRRAMRAIEAAATSAGWRERFRSADSRDAIVARARGRWFERESDELGIFVDGSAAHADVVVHHVRGRPSAAGGDR